MLVRRVVGNSMLPTLRPNQIIIVWQFFYTPKIGHLVMFNHGGLQKVKRVTNVSRNGLFVAGDNPDHSTDSREFGLIRQDKVVGRVILSL